MYIPPVIERYQYKEYSRIEGGPLGRLYACGDKKLPSVTTILQHTMDHAYLELWRERIGAESADLITKQAALCGTFMHENLERRLIGEPDHQGSHPVRVLGRLMADCIQQNAWPSISEVFGQEVKLVLPGLWAGTTDLVGVHNGELAIMDYKNARRHKEWDDIPAYRMQIAAYALAHNECFGTDIRKGVIFICNRQDPRNLQYTEYTVEGDNFEEAVEMWLEHVERFYKIHGDINGSC